MVCAPKSEEAVADTSLQLFLGFVSKTLGGVVTRFLSVFGVEDENGEKTGCHGWLVLSRGCRGLSDAFDSASERRCSVGPDTTHDSPSKYLKALSLPILVSFMLDTLESGLSCELDIIGLLYADAVKVIEPPGFQSCLLRCNHDFFDARKSQVSS